MFFPDSLVNGSGFGKVLRPLAENDLSTPLLEDAIKWLLVNENAIEGVVPALVRHE